MNYSQMEGIQKAGYIIAKLLADKIFFEWEIMHQNHIIDLLTKYNHELKLFINPVTVFQKMIEFEIIKHKHDNYYSTK